MSSSSLSADTIRSKFQISHLFSHIEFQHVLIFILGVATLFYSLVLAGCSSNHPGLSSIYLMSLSYQDPASVGIVGISQNLSSVFTPLVGNAQLTVRAGYFGSCVSSNDVDWTCSMDSTVLTRMFGVEQDPLSLVNMATMFRDSIVFSGLIFLAVVLGLLCICCLLTFPGWHAEFDEQGLARDFKFFPSRVISHSACCVLAAAVLFSLVSSLWQHTAAVATVMSVQNMAYGWVKGQVGPTAMAFSWIALAAYIITLCKLIMMVISIRLLDELVDE